MSAFSTQKAKGKKAEEKVKQHLQSRGNRIIDVSEDEEYQKKDIDFIVIKNGQKTTLEVKLDNSFDKTGNIFIEAYSDYGNYRSPGWIEYCEAKYICFYDTKTAKGMIIDLPLIKSLLDRYAVKKHFYDFQDDKERCCFLFPIGTARRKNAIIYEWED